MKSEIRRTGTPGFSRRQFLGAGPALALGSLFSGAFAHDAKVAERDQDLVLIGLEEHYATPELQKLNGIEFAKGYLDLTSRTSEQDG